MLNLDGKTYTVPGVYGTVEVIQLGNVGLPTFNVLLIVGSAKKGIPYNATGAKGYEVIKPFSSLTAVKDFYGVSDLSDGMDYAKRGGAGVVFCCNLASLTRALATIPDNQGTPESTFDLYPKDQFYGAPGNDISISIATVSTTTTVTIVPPKLTKFLTQNASTTSKVLFLKDVEGLAIGQNVYLTDGTAVSPQATKIESIDTINKKITITDNPSAAFAVAGYSRIYQEDLNSQQIISFDNTTTTIDGLVDLINKGNIVTADRKAYVGILPTTFAKKNIQNISGATKGTSPDATETVGGDHDSFAGLASQLFEEFANFNGFRVRIINPMTSNASVHSVYKTLAKTMRSQQASIQLVLGCALGDIALTESNASHPIQRAKVLNSGDVALVGMGIDSKASYASAGPLVAGMISANSVKRNLTYDSINAVSVEKTFGEFNKDTETYKYVNNGVIVFGTNAKGFFMIQGLNTYQNHAMIWNDQDNTSYLIQQVNIVDFVYEGYKNQMAEGVGADGYGPTVAAKRGLEILKEYYDNGFIKEYKMLNAYRESNAVITNPSIKPIDATDFVGFKLTVEVEG